MGNVLSPWLGTIRSTDPDPVYIGVVIVYVLDRQNTKAVTRFWPFGFSRTSISTRCCSSLKQDRTKSDRYKFNVHTDIGISTRCDIDSCCVIDQRVDTERL